MRALDAERTAIALAAWFERLRAVLDRTVFAAGSDEPHRRAGALGLLTRHAERLLAAGAGEPAASLREAVWVIAAATRVLGVVPGRAEWLAASRNVLTLDADLEALPARGPWLTDDVASIFRAHLEEALKHAGVTRTPTILDAENRRTALGLSVNWGLRFLVAQAAALSGQAVEDAAAQEVVAALGG